MTSGLTVYVQWAATSATTGTIGWDVSFERLVDSGQDLDSDNFGTAQTITAATVSGTKWNHAGHIGQFLTSPASNIPRHQATCTE